VKKTLLLGLVAMLIAAWAHAAYVIVLRNGSRVVAQEKYEVRGSNVVFKLRSGTLTSLPLSQIDVDATEKLNARALGDAVPLDWVDSMEIPPTPTPTPPITALGQLRLGMGRPEGDAALPTPTPGIQFRAGAYRDRQVERVFSHGLEQEKLFFHRISRGTRPEYLFIEVQVGGLAEVNRALQSITRVYHILAGEKLETMPPRIEILLLNEAGREAGTFRLSPEDAAPLATGQVTPEEFYNQHLIF